MSSPRSAPSSLKPIGSSKPVGIGPFVNDDSEDHFDQAALVLVVGDPPLGFVCVELVGGVPHIWQLAVRPDHGRQGLGRALVEAACEWARSQRFDAITLTTYRDVPVERTVLRLSASSAWRPSRPG